MWVGARDVGSVVLVSGRVNLMSPETERWSGRDGFRSGGCARPGSEGKRCFAVGLASSLTFLEQQLQSAVYTPGVYTPNYTEEEAAAFLDLGGEKIY